SLVLRANGGFIKTLVTETSSLLGDSVEYSAPPSALLIKFFWKQFPSMMLALPSPLKIIFTRASATTSASCSTPKRLRFLKRFTCALEEVLFTLSNAATRKPPVPQLGSYTTSRSEIPTASTAKRVT